MQRPSLGTFWLCTPATSCTEADKKQPDPHSKDTHVAPQTGIKTAGKGSSKALPFSLKPSSLPSLPLHTNFKHGTWATSIQEHIQSSSSNTHRKLFLSLPIGPQCKRGIPRLQPLTSPHSPAQHERKTVANGKTKEDHKGKGKPTTATTRALQTEKNSRCTTQAPQLPCR